MADVLLDALLDTLKLFPWLLLIYIIIELIEHKTIGAAHRFRDGVDSPVRVFGHGGETVRAEIYHGRDAPGDFSLHQRRSVYYSLVVGQRRRLAPAAHSGKNRRRRRGGVRRRRNFEGLRTQADARRILPR